MDFRLIVEEVRILQRFCPFSRARRDAAGAGPVCEPAGVLDLLRRLFPYLVAVVLPLAGAVLAVVRFADGDRDDGLRLVAASVLGVFLYLLFVF